MRAIAWAALLLLLGSRPAGDLPSPGWPGADKAAHFLLYAPLGWFSAPPLLRAAGAGLAVGGVDEFLQRSVPGRSSDPFDLLADVLGALAGGLLRRGRSPRRS